MRVLNILLLLALFIFPQYSFGSDESHLFQKGNEYYKLKQYEKAIDAYKEILDRGFESPEIYLNIGNAYFRLGKIGYSVLYFERGRRLDPGDGDLNHNLAFANSRTTDKIETLPGIFLFQWWESIISVFSITGWTVVFYILFLLLLTSLGLFFLARDAAVNRISFFSGIVLVVFLLLNTAVLISRVNTENSEKYAVIMPPSVIVKSSPDKESVDSFIIHEGLKVSIEDKVENWYRLRLEDGKSGWVQKDAFEFI